MNIDKKTFQILGIAAIFLALLTPQLSYGQDIYDRGNALLVLNIDQEVQVGFDGYIGYTKTLPLNNMGKVTATIEFNIEENYYTIELVTWGNDHFARGEGIGARMAIMTDWDFCKNTQTIFGNGHEFQTAVKDLEAKMNGIDGRLSITGTGDPANGTAVITIKVR
ncbi:MAG: hypothetical protein AB8B69_06885 [Chitinophagales bacterium]